MVMRRKKRFAIFGFIIFAVFGLAFVVMYLWNFAISPTFEINEISYWQAMAILVLSKILFGGFRGRGRSGPPWRRKWKRKWDNMSSEDRQKFRAEWRKRCRPEEDISKSE